MKNFLERIITSVLFVIVLLGSIRLHEFAAPVLFFVIIFLCIREFYHFFRESEVSPQKWTGTVGGLLLFAFSVLIHEAQIRLSTLFLIIPIIFYIFIQELFRNRKHPIANIAYTILGIIYIAIPVTLLYEMSFYQDYSFTSSYNHQVVIGFFFVLWANDTGAYLIGSQLGKHPLFPRISPKKSWEGAIGGAALALIVGYVNALLFPNLSVQNWLAIALIIVIFGSLGDLVESMFKRSIGIKDSGKLLPGHGGVLDRFDGIFIAAPMVYTYLRILQLA